MVENLDILFKGKNQVLEFVAPEGMADCIVSSVVFESCDSDESEPEKALVGVAVPSMLSTTFSALSGAAEKNRAIANVVSSDGFKKGGRYLATDAGGECEWIEVREVSFGKLTTRLPMRNAYDVGDEIKSTLITQNLSTSWLSNKDNISDLGSPAPRYRWRLEYVVDCKTYVHAVYFDLVRHSRGYSATILDVDRAFPGFSDKVGTYYREGSEALMQESYRQVKLDMHSAGKADQMARNRELVDDLVIQKAALLLMHAQLYAGANVNIEAIDMANARYTERFQAFVAQPGLSFDTDADGSSDLTNRSLAWRR